MKYIISAKGRLSDEYTLQSGGRAFSIEILGSGGTRSYENLGVAPGHAIEFSISSLGEQRIMGFNSQYAACLGSGCNKRIMDAQEIDDFYMDFSETLKYFGTKIIGITVPPFVTGTPSRRRVRHDLEKIYNNTRVNAPPHLRK